MARKVFTNTPDYLVYRWEAVLSHQSPYLIEQRPYTNEDLTLVENQRFQKIMNMNKNCDKNVAYNLDDSLEQIRKYAENLRTTNESVEPSKVITNLTIWDMRLLLLCALHSLIPSHEIRFAHPTLKQGLCALFLTLNI